MFLLAYRSSKHEFTVTPAELYLGRDLRLPLDLLRGNPPKLQDQELQTDEEHIKNLREKIEKVHTYVREKLSLKSSRVKVQCDRKARQVLFKEGQKVWLYKEDSGEELLNYKEIGKIPLL